MEGLRFFWKIMKPVLNIGYVETSGRKPIMKEVDLILQGVVDSCRIAGS